MSDRRKYTSDSFIKKLKENGYIYISGEYKNNYSNGELICEYDSIKDAIKATGLKSISSVLNSGRNVYGGYCWKYKYN